MGVELTTYVPYAPASDAFNLGGTYNRLMDSSPTEWVCFLDHDAMFLRPDWYPRICKAIDKLTDAGLISVQATRIARAHQRWPGYDKVHNIPYLRRKAQRLNESPMRTTDEVSGVVIVTNKTTWEAVGGFSPGFLGVDWDYSQRVRESGCGVYLLRDCPVYHYYRANGDVGHTRKANQLWSNPYHQPLR